MSQEPQFTDVIDYNGNVKLKFDKKDAKHKIRSVKFKFTNPADPLKLTQLLNEEGLALTFSTPISILNDMITFKPNCELLLSRKEKIEFYTVQTESEKERFNLSTEEAILIGRELESESDAIALLVSTIFLILKYLFLRRDVVSFMGMGIIYDYFPLPSLYLSTGSPIVFQNLILD